jgi:hypothetical protein
MDPIERTVWTSILDRGLFPELVAEVWTGHAEGIRYEHVDLRPIEQKVMRRMLFYWLGGSGAKVALREWPAYRPQVLRTSRQLCMDLARRFSTATVHSRNQRATPPQAVRAGSGVLNP